MAKKNDPKQGRTVAGRFEAKCTPKIKSALEKLLREGVPLSLASPSAGVHYTTVLRWMRDSPEFEADISTARAEGKISLFRNTAEGDRPGFSFGKAKASLELLSRIDKQFAPRVNMKAAEEIDGFLELLSRKLPREWYRVALQTAAEYQDPEE